MVGKWTVDGKVYDSDHSKTKRFESITDDVVFDIDFVPQSYYTVNYSVVGNYGADEGGSIQSATTDTVPFESGKTDVGGGSTVVITSKPAAGWMVKEWKIDDAVVTNEKDPTAAYQGNVLTIKALSGKEEVVDITVEFQEIASYSVTVESDSSWVVTWDNESKVRKDGDKVLQGETLVFTVKATAGYKLIEAVAEGDSFDCVVDNEDGSKTCTVYALGENLTVGARAKKLHGITTLGAANGAISATPRVAAAGDTVTITATPDNNYQVKSLSATYRDGENNEKSLTISADYRFTMPDADVEVSATFEYAGGGGSGGGSVAPTYTVTIGASENGKVTASHSSASEGDTVTLSVVADKDYELAALTVTNESGGKVKLTETNGKFAFTMPASKVTVEAVFTAIAGKAENPFTDVPGDAYFADAVIWAVGKGITSGTTATTFSPNASCTRGQMVTFLWRAAGSPASASSKMPFTDVPVTAYYYDAVLWAVEQGITSGTTATTFSPNATVTRAQAVTFLWRAAGSEVIQTAAPFVDVKYGMYYYNAVAWAVENDITNGTSQTTFSPTQNCTRAQIVTFIWRYMGA